MLHVYHLQICEVKARWIKPKGITPLKPQVLKTIHVTCRLKAHSKRIRGDRHSQDGKGRDGPTDAFDFIEDRHLPNEWFPPSGFMTPTRKERTMRSLHGIFYQIEASKPLESAIKFGPTGAGWPLGMRQQDLSSSTQILLDWMTEAGVIQEFEELFQGRDQIKASEISDWWDESEVDTRDPETTIQPTGKTKEVLRDHPA